ncbi:MAG: LysR family transcriptional regulator [Proteobacteria bacterium]|nr:LysR family transcriptional regulator [Pseudomonadota bacterium]
MQLGRVRIFVEVARQQSFAAAAAALGITGPAASKQVMALEDELGVKLLHRTTRKVTLTDEGAVYFERVKHALEELEEAAGEVRELRAAPKGVLKINAPLSFAHMHLLPVLSGFARKYPELCMDVSLEDRMVDVIADGFDVVIRIGVLHDSSLVMRPLAECPIVPVASPGYVRHHGAPGTPAELKRHRIIGYAYQGGQAEWKFRDAQGKTGTVRNECSFRANTAEMMLQAALDGVGIATLPLFVVATYVQAGQLVRLLPDYDTHPMRQIVALMPPSRYRSAKVKLFLNWLDEACKAMPMDLPGMRKFI